MNRITAIPAAALLLLSGCIAETFPQSTYVTEKQASDAPGGYDNFVSACTSTLIGEFVFGTDYYPFDFGYPSFFLQRDVMGQDIVIEDGSSEHYSTWYQVTSGLGPQYLICQVPWSYYYQWINNCNIVIRQAGESPDAEHITGAGIAHAMRAMFYMDLARMYQSTYKGNEQAETVPVITEKTTLAEGTKNPRATNERIWKFILEDLGKAERYLDGYARPDKTTPDISVVHGLMARAYLTMEDFPNAEKYAALARKGYSSMTEAEYLSRETGFNTPNASWMLCTEYDAEHPNITANDADSCWGSQMILEMTTGCGYAANYGTPKRIDKHLYETIPATDFRKKCFVDPAIDGMSPQDQIEALKAYSDVPDQMIATAQATTSKNLGCLSLKFRAAGGAEGRANQYKGFCVAVPMMRVEEMILIEAEAAGMQDEGRGKTLLENFAKTRDPQYAYDNTKPFRDNVWWQRRVELWGEGFATFDIKRLGKGIVRSYAGSNHPKGYRYNTETVPQWMNLCIVQSETNFNTACTNNPTPVKPAGDSPEHVW